MNGNLSRSEDWYWYWFRLLKFVAFLIKKKSLEDDERWCSDKVAASWWRCLLTFSGLLLFSWTPASRLLLHNKPEHKSRCRLIQFFFSEATQEVASFTRPRVLKPWHNNSNKVTPLLISAQQCYYFFFFIFVSNNFYRTISAAAASQLQTIFFCSATNGPWRQSERHVTKCCCWLS